jgi:peptide-methionine (S)-S-oxide reductase
MQLNSPLFVLRMGILSWLAATLLQSCAEPKAQAYMMSETVDIFSPKDTAIFANGCFWCTEAVFQRLDGVLKVTSGYSGGHVKNPTYEQVCDKSTGHAECIRIEYNPDKISYDELLEVFWKTHDPTTPNQQGADKGPQYRSAVFYLDEEQKQKAEYYKTQLDKEKAFPKPIVTAIEPFRNFYPAEDYHQNYYNNNSEQMYCRFVIQPKLDKLEKVFANKLKK